LSERGFDLGSTGPSGKEVCECLPVSRTGRAPDQKGADRAPFEGFETR
jgi:hypothetical protein